MTPESTIAPVRLIGLEKHLVVVDLDEHERLLLVVERRRHRRRAECPPAQLPARPGDEMRDALLWRQPFVDVVVSREHDVDAALGQQRFERHAQRHIRSVPAGVGVQRMVEVADFPRLLRLLQRAVDPRPLPRVELVAVERDEPHVLSDEGVVRARRPC